MLFPELEAHISPSLLEVMNFLPRAGRHVKAVGGLLRENEQLRAVSLACVLFVRFWLCVRL